MCNERYIHPFTDFGFKRLFGNEANKAFMISILNSLLECEDKITDITYLNTEKLGMAAEKRVAVFDIYCRTDSGDHIIVEMQNVAQHFFVDRSIYYSTFPLQEAAQKGSWNFNIPRVFTLAFLNFRLPVFANSPDVKHVIRLSDVKTGREFSDKLTYIYIELPKFTKTKDELDTPLDTWLYVINNINELDSCPPELKDEIYREFFNIAEIQKFTYEERLAYEESLKAMRDYYNTIQTTREDSYREGKAETIKSIAIAMLKREMDIEEIASILGLTIEEIEKIKQEIQ